MNPCWTQTQEAHFRSFPLFFLSRSLRPFKWNQMWISCFLHLRHTSYQVKITSHLKHCLVCFPVVEKTKTSLCIHFSRGSRCQSLQSPLTFHLSTTTTTSTATTTAFLVFRSLLAQQYSLSCTRYRLFYLHFEYVMSHFLCSLLSLNIA